jgi:hypothetical protein
MCKLPETFTELRITRAYIKLLCIPQSEPGATVVSLGRVGKYEIRMFEASQAGSSDSPLFWMELFDPAAQMCVNSCVCRSIKDAVDAYEDFTETLE